MNELLQINPGVPGVIEVRDKTRKKYTTFFRGLRAKAYVIMDHPLEDGRPVPMADGTVCVVRFIHEGHIHGFLSRVMALVRKPAPLIFLEYPEDVETSKLRKYDRYPVHLAAALARDKSNGRLPDPPPCLVLNISAGGCMLRSEEPYTKGTFLFMSVQLPEIGWVHDIEVEVMRSEIQDGAAQLGLAYMDLLDPNYERVKGFLHMLQAFQVRA
jgi:c-di-GMP-binding flagellar brake protein YcgR